MAATYVKPTPYIFNTHQWIQGRLHIAENVPARRAMSTVTVTSASASGIAPQFSASSEVMQMANQKHRLMWSGADSLSKPSKRSGCRPGSRSSTE